LAPEVLNFEQLEYDERADIYSFAIVLWEMASRQTPFLDEYWERFQRNGYFQEKDCQRYPPAPHVDVVVFSPNAGLTHTRDL
jgi:serine/threonine protein kinase